MAMRRRDSSAAREIFVLLLGRTERLNRERALRAIARTPSLRGGSITTVREDLLQELTLHLWSEMAIGNDEAWEIFFTRALSFAQRHVATAFMERNGYWVASNVRTPSREIAIPFSRLAARYETDERSGGEWPPLAAGGWHGRRRIVRPAHAGRAPSSSCATGRTPRNRHRRQSWGYASRRPRHACPRLYETTRRLRA
jgi:hypothetical protein